VRCAVETQFYYDADMTPARVRKRVEFLEYMGAECAQDWQKIERLLARVKALEDAINLTLSGKAGYWPDVLRAALKGSANDGSGDV
jgi:hypothetical protein